MAEPLPWPEAVERFAGKSPVAADLTSEQWASVPLAIRERAFFSARVAQAHVLEGLRSRLQEMLELARRDGTGVDRSRLRAEIRALLGAPEGETGRITDIASRARLDLIVDFQEQDAAGYGKWKQDVGDPDLLDAFPAQELVRDQDRRQPRDWWARWGEAGAAVGWVGASRRRMAALKSSPIWAQLSRFGRPWPPFDYSSGMGLRDLDPDEARELGVPLADQPPQAGQRMQDTFNAGLRASVDGLPEAVVAEVESLLRRDGVAVRRAGGDLAVEGSA